MIGLLLAFAASAQNAGQDFRWPTDLVKQTKIVLDGLTIHPVQTGSPYEAQTVVGAVVLAMDDSRVVAYSLKTRKELWSLKTPSEGFADVYDHDDRYACLAPFGDGEYASDTPDTLWVLDTKAEKWLQPIHIEKLSASGNDSDPDIDDAIVRNGKVAILASQELKGQASPATYACAVSLYRVGVAKPIWTKRFNHADDYVDSRTFWGPRGSTNGEGVKQLSWIGDDVLVCASGKSPVFVLDHSGGTTIGQIDRPWEYDQGSTGPSMFTYYIGRFGYQDRFPDNPEWKAAYEAAEADFNKHSYGRVAAGPIAIPCRVPAPIPQTADGPEPLHPPPVPYSIFLIAAREPHSDWPRMGIPFGSLRLYEFDSAGNPISLLDLPHYPARTWPHADAGKIIWPMDSNGLLSCAPTPQPVQDQFVFGSEKYTQLDYYRDYAATFKAWIYSDPGTSEVAFSPGFAFRCIDGGFIRSEDEPSMRFPIGVVDLQTGVEREADIVLPLTRPATAPDMNVFSTARGMHTLFSYMFWISHITCVGDRVRFGIASDKWSGFVDFPISALTSTLKTNEMRR